MILVTPEGKQAEFIDAIKSGEKYIIVEIILPSLIQRTGIIKKCAFAV